MTNSPHPERETGGLYETDHAALKAAAEKATPGPWIRSGVRRKMGDEDCIMVGPDGFLIAALPIGQPRDHAAAFCDAAFIAAANPETVIALLNERTEASSTIRAQAAELERYREALEPSGATKADYHGEFSMPVATTEYDEDGEPETLIRQVPIPWTTVKEIMAAIKARALKTEGTSNDG